MRDKFNAMRTAYDLAFKNAFEAASTTYEKFCMTVGDAAHTTIELPFLEQFADMRRWVGARQIKNLEGKMLTMIEDAYEDTIGIPTRKIETDNWGVYMPAIQQMAVNGKVLWDKLAAEALVNAGKWLDDKPFFNTGRKYGDSVICNTTTAELTAETFNTAYDTMSAYCGHKGVPLTVVPDTLIVGPALRSRAHEILVSQYTVDSTGKVTVENPNKGLVEIIINPRLVGKAAKNWYLACCKGPIKPIAIQKSKDAVLVSKNQPTDEGVFMEDQALFGTSAYGSAAPAFPHLLYGGIVTA